MPQAGARSRVKGTGGSDLSAEIARVAYELFLSRGGEHGHDLEDWTEAERVVRQRAAAPRGARAKQAS
jgi:hypothetical protein